MREHYRTLLQCLAIALAFIAVVLGGVAANQEVASAQSWVEVVTRVHAELLLVTASNAVVALCVCLLGIALTSPRYRR